MNKTNYPLRFKILQLLLFAGAFIGYSSGLLVWPIHKVTPMFLLPLLVAFCMYEEELPAAFVALLLGVFVDSTSSFGGVFHTVYFFAVGLLTALFIHYYMNNNIRSAIVLTLLWALLYYLLRWLFRHVLNDTMVGSTVYLMQYAIPSTVYTTVYILPFYYLERCMHHFKSK